MTTNLARRPGGPPIAIQITGVAKWLGLRRVLRDNGLIRLPSLSAVFAPFTAPVPALACQPGPLAPHSPSSNHQVPE